MTYEKLPQVESDCDWRFIYVVNIELSGANGQLGRKLTLDYNARQSMIAEMRHIHTGCVHGRFQPFENDLVISKAPHELWIALGAFDKREMF